MSIQTPLFPAGKALALLASVVCALYFSPTATASSENYSVSWESKFNLPAQDANGFSIYKPSSDSRIIYVSSVDGNDSTAQPYTSSAVGNDYRRPSIAIKPYRTVSAALAQARAGYPDYVLFKRGDVFQGTLTAIKGRSKSERSVFSWYGTNAARPLFKSGSGSGLLLAGYKAGMTDFIVAGLEFRANLRDPSDANFAGFSNLPKNLGIDATSQTFISGVLIEDCKFEFFDGNVIQADPGKLSDTILRRNIIAKGYPGGSGHNQGLYTYNASIMLEENLFYHNGWWCQAGSSGCSIGQGTLYNHNTYMGNSTDAILRRNIYMSASSMNMKFTANPTSGYNEVKTKNLLVDNNLLVDAEIGISIWGNNDYDNNPRWDNIIINNNIIQQAVSRPVNRDLAWGIELKDLASGKITNNIISSLGTNETTNNSWGMNISDGISNTQITGNKLYNINGSDSMAFLTVRSYSGSNNLISGNAFISASDTRPLLSLSTLNGINVNSNTYYSIANSDRWFAGTAPSDVSSGRMSSRPNYVAPDRTIYTYFSTLGVAARMDAIYDQLSKQSILNWQSKLTFDTISAYLRSGFCIKDQPCSESSNPGVVAPPNPPSNLGAKVQ